MRVDYDVVEMVVVSVVLVGASAAWYSAVDPLVMKVKAAAGGIMRCVLSWHLLPLQTRFIDAGCGQVDQEIIKAFLVFPPFGARVALIQQLGSTEDGHL